MSNGQEPPGVAFALHRPLSWTTPYMLDYGICRKPLTLVRVFSVALRWYDEPDLRLRQIESMRTYLPEHKRYGSDAFEANMGVLIDSDAPLYPHIDPLGFAVFLYHLSTHSVLRGGPLLPGVDPVIAQERPGCALVWGLWNLYLPNEKCPYPFWIFPRPSELPPP